MGLNMQKWVRKWRPLNAQIWGWNTGSYIVKPSQGFHAQQICGLGIPPKGGLVKDYGSGWTWRVCREATVEMVQMATISGIICTGRKKSV